MVADKINMWIFLLLYDFSMYIVCAWSKCYFVACLSFYVLLSYISSFSSIVNLFCYWFWKCISHCNLKFQYLSFYTWSFLFFSLLATFKVILFVTIFKMYLSRGKNQVQTWLFFFGAWLGSNGKLFVYANYECEGSCNCKGHIIYSWRST